jgi:hypothetical protein
VGDWRYYDRERGNTRGQMQKFPSVGLSHSAPLGDNAYLRFIR